MKHFGTAFIVLLMAVAAIGQEWDREPADVRGVPFGATEKEVKKAIGSRRCFDNAGQRMCDTSFDLNGHSIIAEYFLSGDRVVEVNFRFQSDSYAFLRDVFIEKYGAPSSTEVVPTRTKAGGEYQNEVLVWSGQNLRLTLRQFSGDIDHGRAVFKTLEQIAKDASTSSSATKDAATKF